MEDFNLFNLKMLLYTDTLIHDTLYTDIDDTLAQIGAENRANHDNDDIVHIMNNFE